MIMSYWFVSMFYFSYVDDDFNPFNYETDCLLSSISDEEDSWPVWMNDWMTDWPFIPIHREGVTWKRNAYNSLNVCIYV